MLHSIIARFISRHAHIHTLSASIAPVPPAPAKLPASFNLLCVIAINALGTFGDYLSLSSIGYLVYRNLGLAMSGIFLSVPMALGCIASLLLASLIDRRLGKPAVARRVLIVLSLLLGFIAIGLRWENYYWIMAILMVKEILYYIKRSVYNLFLPEVIDRAKMERNLGIFSTVDLFAKGIGLSAAPLIVNLIGFNVFLIDAAVCFISILLFKMIITVSAEKVPDTVVTTAAVTVEKFGWRSFPISALYVTLFVIWLAANVLWGARETLGIAIISKTFFFDISWIGTYNAIAEVGGGIAGVIMACNLFFARLFVVRRAVIAILLLALGFISLYLIARYIPAITNQQKTLVGILIATLKLLEGMGSTFVGIICMQNLVFSMDVHFRAKASALLTTSGLIVLAAAKALTGVVAHKIDSPGFVYFVLGVSVTVLAVGILTAMFFRSVKNAHAEI